MTPAKNKPTLNGEFLGVYTCVNKHWGFQSFTGTQEKSQEIF